MKEVTNLLPNCPTVCSLYETMGIEKKMTVHLKTIPLFLGIVFVARNRGWQSDGGCPVESSSGRWNFGQFNNVSIFFLRSYLYNHVQQLKVFKLKHIG